jgi:hypothetical protein
MRKERDLSMRLAEDAALKTDYYQGEIRIILADSVKVALVNIHVL